MVKMEMDYNMDKFGSDSFEILLKKITNPRSMQEVYHI